MTAGSMLGLASKSNARSDFSRGNRAALMRRSEQQWVLRSEQFTDWSWPGADPADLILDVPVVDQLIQLRERVDLGHRHQPVAAKPADLSLDSAFCVGALDVGLAVKGLDPIAGAERRPAFGLDPLPGESQYLGDRGLEVVVADLAERDPPSTLKACA